MAGRKREERRNVKVILIIGISNSLARGDLLIFVWRILLMHKLHF
jgi:hypothetical protein